jgi:uncharacterized protein (DUF1499 family)
MTKDESERIPMLKTRWVPGLVLVALLSACSGGSQRANTTLAEGQLAPCPESPNCVSSQARAESQRVDAMRHDGDGIQAQARLLRVLRGMARVTVIGDDASYVHAEFRSALLGFVDDVEFHFDPPGTIQVRSASRVGYSDFGVNRARVTAIRDRFATLAGAPS